MNTRFKDAFRGKVVNKRLTINTGVDEFPRFVVEYLIDNYCTEESFHDDLQQVIKRLRENFVHGAEAEKIRHQIRETRNHNIIANLEVRLQETEDRYWGTIGAINESFVNVTESLVRQYPMLLSGGMWGTITLTYDETEVHNKKIRPFKVTEFTPFQISVIDLNDYIEKRKQFEAGEWLDFLINSIGLNPEPIRSCSTCGGSCRWSRPIATPSSWPQGKRARPTSTAIRAITRLFFLAARRLRQVCLSTTLRAKSAWSEAATWWRSMRSLTLTSLTRRPSCRSCRAICRTPSSAEGRRKSWPLPPSSCSATSTCRRNYRTRSITICSSLCPIFSRSRLLSIDFMGICQAGRFRRFIPARWRKNYGFITDYFCEIMHELRRKDPLGSLKSRYQLMDTSTAKAGITGRDVRGVEKVLSGLLKLMYPHGEVTDEQLGELLEVALEGRQRVRNQLHLMAAGEYGPVVLTGKLVQSGKLITPRLPDAEREQKVTLPSSPRVGEIIGLAVIGDDRGCLLHFEMQASKGSGRIINLGSMQKVMKESVAAAAQFIKTHAQDVGLPNDWQDKYDIAVLATMMGVPKEGPSAGITIVTGIVSALTGRPVRNELAMTGEITIMGKVLAIGGVLPKLQAAIDAGCSEVLMPKENERDVQMTPDYVKNKIKVRFVSSIDEVLAAALLECPTIQ